MTSATVSTLTRRLLPTLVAALWGCLCFSPTAANAQDVLASRYDDARTGAALRERLLTPHSIDRTIDSEAFGLLFRYKLDVAGEPAGDIYAQPLFVSRVGVPGRGTKNLLLVATMKNFVFALDADGPTGSDGGLLWQRSLGLAPQVDDVWRNCSVANPCLDRGSNIRGTVGIMATPVIDRVRGIVFIIARVLVDPDHVVYRLHALDLREGRDLSSSPIEIGGTAQGVSFNPNYQNQRSGLALARGQIIVAFGSYADLLPYHGWVFSYRYSPRSGFNRTGAFVTTPDGDTSFGCALPLPFRNAANNCAHGGIWMGGRAPAVDLDGRVLVMVGNGINDMSTNIRRNFGNSLVALDPVSLEVIDFFTPENHLAINAMDLDFGGSGPMIIPGSRIVVGGGKEGVLYVWNLDNLGGFAAGDPRVLQKFPVGIVQAHADTGNDMPGGAVIGGFVISQHAGHIMGGPVFWPRPVSAGGSRLYNWSENSQLRAYSVDGSAALPIAEQVAALGADIQYGHPGGILTLSANGATAGSGIVWASNYDASGTSALGQGLTGALNDVRPGMLRAYAADDLRLLWSSEINAARDRLGNFAKFNPPTVANGRVYMATFSDEILVYGLFKHRYVRPAAEIMSVVAPSLLDEP
jgi:outer membrane protein assembly factor BamB